MRRFIKIISFLFPCCLAAQPQIDVVFPASNQTLEQSDHHFIYGNVKPANSKFWINGRSVLLYKNGAFMAYLRVEPGDFIFHCIAVADKDTASYSVPVIIAKEKKLLADSLAIDIASMSPAQDLILTAGDELEVSLRATPGCEVSFRIEGTGRWFPLSSEKGRSDCYSGSVLLRDESDDYLGSNGYGNQELSEEELRILNGKIEIQVKHPAGDLISHSFGNVTVTPEPMNRVVELVADRTVVQVRNEERGDLILPHGTRLVITGKSGDYWRVGLGRNKSGWLEEGTFTWLPENAALPQSELGSVRLERLDGYSRIKIPLQTRVPFHVEQTVVPSRLSLTIWGAHAPDDSVIAATDDEFVKRISAKMSEEGSLHLTIDVKLRKQWGYLAQYEGSTLQLDIRHPPKSLSKSSPLKDRMILLDPGHQPDEGAIGPTRLEERNVNWFIADKLRGMLKEKGATVFVTRSQEDGSSIESRIQMVEILHPDVAVSIHNNSVPEGFNPYRGRGTSSYYYHPHSYRLTQTLHRNLTKDLGLPSQGVRFADLAICRPTAAPLALVEPAYIILPRQEYLLGTDQFQTKIAKSLMRGLEQFFREASDEKY